MNVSTMNCVVLLVLFVISECAALTQRSSLLDSSQCPTPRLKNGKIRARGRGRIIRYSCYTDFELVGNRYSTCIRGSWDTPTPICVSPRCPAMPAPKHAVVGEKYHGAILMYFCEPGYVLVGNSEIYCDGRHWNGTAPYCRDSNAVAPTSCDFEKDGLCWWEQDPKHDFDWIRHRFDTPSSHIGTGPTHDHTLGTGYDGYYLYIEASGRLVNDTARIISPLYSANLTDSGCFSFWYHMYGTSIGSLNVYFKQETDKTPRIMWSKQGNQGNQWFHGLFNLPSVNSSFQLIIEGVRGSSYVSDIAIDDLALLHGDECVVKNVTTPAPATDGDEVEVFNAMQSCRGRCVNTITETTQSPEVYTSPDVCQCTIDCAETSSCCPDYAEFCLYETEQLETIMPTTMTANDATSTSVMYSPTEEHVSKVETERTTITKTSAIPTVTTASTTEKPTTSPPATSTTPKPSTSAPSTTSKPTTTTTTTEKPVYTSTTKKLRSTESPVVTTSKPVPTRIETVATKPTTRRPTTTSTVKPTSTTVRKEIQFVTPPPKPKTTSDNTPIETETHIIVQDASRIDPNVSPTLPGVIGIIIGILTGVTMIAVVAMVIIRRRTFYKRGSNGSAFSEDSDVRFLTSDEVLDFNLARPNH